GFLHVVRRLDARVGHVDPLRGVITAWFLVISHRRPAPCRNHRGGCASFGGRCDRRHPTAQDASRTRLVPHPKGVALKASSPAPGPGTGFGVSIRDGDIFTVSIP